jgi:hypothetical protein
VINAQSNHDLTPENRNCFYVRTIINQPNIGYTHKLNSVWGLSFEAGYQFCLLNEIHYTGAPMAIDKWFRNLGYQGFNVGLGPELKLSQRWKLNPILGYANLFAPKVFYDPGDFAGEDTKFSVYSQKVNEISFKIIFLKSFRKAPIQFYVGQGMKFQFYYNAYSIEGYGHIELPSNRIETGLNTIYNFLIVGFKFKFIQI